MRINRADTNYTVKSKQNNTNNNTSRNASFKGGLPLDSFCRGFSNIIETGGFMVSFLIVDGLGTVAPRIIKGMGRNKDENNGEFNYRFAAKEATREITSGPSIFVIPYIMDKFSQKYLGKFFDVFGQAGNVSSKFIKAFGDIHTSNILKDGQVADKQNFYKNTFAEIIKNAKGDSTIVKSTENKAEEYAKRLSDAINSKQKGNVEKTINSLYEDFVSISKSNASDAVHTDFTIAKLKDASGSFKQVTSNMISYADDVVEKALKQAPEQAKEYTNNLVNKKVAGRFASNIAKFFAILGFFQYIPKLYNKVEGDENTGLKGLMKQETFQDNKLNDKSNPSFGSSLSSVAKSLAGNGSIGKFASTMEFEGSSMTFYPLASFMCAGILYPRIKEAKDDYDKEEIIRRDVITCGVMCVGEKILRKIFSKFNEEKSGFVLALKDKNFDTKNAIQKALDYVKPVDGIKLLSSEQIRTKYSDIDKYKDGIKGFCDFISGQGGDLRKVFGLTEESKEIVEGLLKNEGKDFASSDNKIISDVLNKAKDSDEVKKLAGLFHKSYKKSIDKPSLIDKLLKRTETIEDNPWVRKARTSNARFTALSVLVLVPVFLGFMLPSINEHYTKKRIKKELENKKANPSNNNNNNIDFINKTKKHNPIFADMEKFVK